MRYFLLVLAFASTLQAQDISGSFHGSYIGNAISPEFHLKIGGGKWVYTSSDDMFGRVKKQTQETRGDYEIDGDLAVFTSPRSKFALNFGFPDGKVTFNQLFPSKEGFSYRRRFYRKEGNEWRPAEERRLVMSPPEGDVWKARLIGARVRWNEGKKTEDPFDFTLTYTKKEGRYRTDKADTWMPSDIFVETDQAGKITMLRFNNGYVGDLRGFHPQYGDR